MRPESLFRFRSGLTTYESKGMIDGARFSKTQKGVRFEIQVERLALERERINISLDTRGERRND